MDTTCTFAGFLPPTSSTTYTPNQFFDVVLRHSSRGAVRLVAYLLRKTLGWCDAEGKPQESQVRVSYRDLEERAGIGHTRIAEAVRECLERRYIVQVRAGQPDRKDAPAVTACYALRWDDREEYVADPERFRGFFSGNGNLTYIPNQFFDHLVPSEPLSVIKVVGAILRNTIGYQTRFGFRRQQVQLSITDLERITQLNRDTVRLALQDALTRNYISRLEEGAFDPNGGRESRAATYGIRWQDDFHRHAGSSPAPLDEALAEEHSQNPYGDALPKSGTPHPEPARHLSQNPHGDHTQNPHDNEITGNNTSGKQQQIGVAPPAAAADGLPETAREGYAQLLGLGFEDGMARQLAASYPAERIARQCAWLPRRNPCRNTRGLLRKAIEEDWPEPKAEAPTQTPAARFAAHYPAGWSGGKREPLPHPTTGDVAAAEAFLPRLLGVENTPEKAAAWGRDFGAFARRNAGRAATRPPSLSHALAEQGDEFLEECRERERKARRIQRVAAQHRHQEIHYPQYLSYLRAHEEHLRREHPDAYARFMDKEAQQKAFITQCKLSARSLASFEAEEARLMRLHLFFAGDAEHSVLDFWGWDETINPEGFHPMEPTQERTPHRQQSERPTLPRREVLGEPAQRSA